MAGFDPSQPRDEEGKWTEAGFAARKAAGLNPYNVPPRKYAKNIDFSGQDVVVSINNENIVYTFKKNFPPIRRASEMDKAVVKQIAAQEKEFYDNPNSTGPEEHVEVRLELVTAGYQIRYTTFDTLTGEILGDWWNDFIRCPVCTYPSIAPDFEAAYNSCSTCNAEYRE